MVLPHFHAFCELIRSLTNNDCGVVDSVSKKINLCFTYESRNTLKSFSLFLTVKNFLELNMEHSVKLEIEI